MSTVFSALAVSVDGYITGRAPRPGHGLGDGGRLFDWYGDDDPRNRRVYEALAARVGVTLAGRTTYDDSERFADTDGPHPTAPLVVLSHRPAPGMGGRQRLVSTGIADAVAVAKEVAGDKDVALMGGGVVSAALEAGLVDELVLHQVPILLGSGRPFFRTLPRHVRLRLIEAVAAPGVTHLHYAVEH